MLNTTSPWRQGFKRGSEIAISSAIYVEIAGINPNKVQFIVVESSLPLVNGICTTFIAALVRILSIDNVRSTTRRDSKVTGSFTAEQRSCASVGVKCKRYLYLNVCISSKFTLKHFLRRVLYASSRFRSHISLRIARDGRFSRARVIPPTLILHWLRFLLVLRKHCFVQYFAGVY